MDAAAEVAALLSSAWWHLSGKILLLLAAEAVAVILQVTVFYLEVPVEQPH